MPSSGDAVRSPHHALRGYWMIACATLLWATSANIGRAMFTGRFLAAEQLAHPITALPLAQMRATVSAMVLGTLLLLWRGPRSLSMPPRDAAKCLMLGIVGLAASNFFYYFAIQSTSVASAIIVQYTAPAWVLIYLALHRKQYPSAAKIGAVALAIAGCALVAGVVGGSAMKVSAIGVGAALLASFGFAFYSVFGHDLLKRYDRRLVVLYAFAGAALLWMFVHPPWLLFSAGYSARQWEFLVVFSLTSSLLPFALYFAGLQFVDATSAIVTCCLEPVLSILLAASVLGESLLPLQIAGVVVVLSAIVLVQWPEKTASEFTVEPLD